MICHAEVTDEEGLLDECGKPAVAERIDPADDHLYPVCADHRGPLNLAWDRGRSRWLVTNARGRIVDRFATRRFAMEAMVRLASTTMHTDDESCPTCYRERTVEPGERLAEIVCYGPDAMPIPVNAERSEP